MNEYVIRTENLTKEYGGQAAVDRINLHVPKGKIYALLGRNGAGEAGADARGEKGRAAGRNTAGEGIRGRRRICGA